MHVNLILSARPFLGQSLEEAFKDAKKIAIYFSVAVEVDCTGIANVSKLPNKKILIQPNANIPEIIKKIEG